MKLSNIFESLLNEASGGKYHVRFNLAPTADWLTKKSIERTWQVKINKTSVPLDVNLLKFIKVAPINNLDGGNEVNDKPEVENTANYTPEEFAAIKKFMNSDAFSKVPMGGVTNNFDKDYFHLELSDCTLVNVNPSVGYSIKCYSDKGVIAGVDAGDVKIYFGTGKGNGTEIFYNPRTVPHFIMKIDGDPFMSIKSQVIPMGVEVDDKKTNKKVEKLNVRKFENDRVYSSCVNTKTPPDKTKYFYLELNGIKYVKVVGETVTDYKSSGEVYKIVDGEKFGKIITKGGKLFSVS